MPQSTPAARCCGGARFDPGDDLENGRTVYAFKCLIGEYVRVVRCGWRCKCQETGNRADLGGGGLLS